MPALLSTSNRCTALVSTATSITSPLFTRERGPNRPTSVVFVSPSAGAWTVALVPDVAGQLADVLGQRRRSVDLEVRDDLRAERLAEDEDTLDVTVLRDVGSEARVLQAFRADAQHDLSADVSSSFGRDFSDLLVEGQLLASDLGDHLAVGPLDGRLDEVHRGRADEAADEEVDRPLVELLRRRDLLEHALAHDRDAVAHRHRLDLVVRHVDRRHAELVLQPGDLGAHLHAELRVEVRERLVHEERLRLADDRAAHRHALPLAAGERARLPLEELLEPEDARGLADAAVDLVLRRLAQPQAERDVVVDGHVRVERVALEDHRDVAVARRDVVDDALADPQTTPSLISSSPATMRSAVVFPQPDGPTSTMNSPSAISRSIPDTARVPSGYTLPTPSNVTLAIGSPFDAGQREWASRGSETSRPLLSWHARLGRLLFLALSTARAHVAPEVMPKNVVTPGAASL